MAYNVVASLGVKGPVLCRLMWLILSVLWQVGEGWGPLWTPPLAWFGPLVMNGIAYKVASVSRSKQSRSGSVLVILEKASVRTSLSTVTAVE